TLAAPGSARSTWGVALGVVPSALAGAALGVGVLDGAPPAAQHGLVLAGAVGVAAFAIAFPLRGEAVDRRHLALVWLPAALVGLASRDIALDAGLASLPLAALAL